MYSRRWVEDRGVCHCEEAALPDQAIPYIDEEIASGWHPRNDIVM